MSVLGWRLRLVCVWNIPILVHWSMLGRPAIYLTYWIIAKSVNDGPPLELDLLWRKIQILLIVEGVLNISILVHELSHAWASMFLGKGIDSIILHGLGGLCMFKDPDPFDDSAWRQAVVFGAGPASNVCLAGVALLLTPSGGEIQLVHIVIECTLFLNVLLAILNLIPIFPLDGSRVLEALLKVCGIASRRASTSVYAISILLAPFLCHQALSNQDYILALLSIILFVFSIFLVWDDGDEDEQSDPILLEPPKCEMPEYTPHPWEARWSRFGDEDRHQVVQHPPSPRSAYHSVTTRIIMPIEICGLRSSSSGYSFSSPMLGHYDLSMTMRYSHLAPVHSARAVEILDSAYQSDTKTDTVKNSGNDRLP